MDQIAANRELADGLLLKVSEATSGITGHDFILELTRKIPSILGMRHCFVAECANEEKTRLRTIAFPEGENVLDNIEYSTSESACREMMGGQPYFLNKGAHLIYKAAKGIEAYVGAPILNPTKSMKMRKGTISLQLKYISFAVLFSQVKLIIFYIQMLITKDIFKAIRK